MVINTNIKAIIGKLPKHERGQFISDITERQNTRDFFETVETLTNLEPVTNQGVGWKLARLVGSDWDKAARFHPAYPLHTIEIELRHLIQMLSHCTKIASEANAELQDIAQKNNHNELYDREIALRMTKEFYSFVHLAKSIIDVGRRVRLHIK